MIRRIVAATALTLTLVAPLASNASIFGHSNDGTTTTAPKVKMVKLTIKNKSAADMTVYLDGKAMTLAANGGSQEIKVAAGSDILNADQSTVRLHVTSELGGNTVSFR